MFLAQGASVIGTARSAAALDKVAAEFKALAASPHRLRPGGPCRAGQAGAAVAQLWDRVDILVNNAAVQTWKKIGSTRARPCSRSTCASTSSPPFHHPGAAAPHPKGPRAAHHQRQQRRGHVQGPGGVAGHAHLPFDQVRAQWRHHPLGGRAQGPGGRQQPGPGLAEDRLGRPQRARRAHRRRPAVLALAGLPFSATGKFYTATRSSTLSKPHLWQGTGGLEPAVFCFRVGARRRSCRGGSRELG